MKLPIVVAIIAIFGSLAATGAVSAADKTRGRILYEARCVGCHDTSVHRRESRKATSFEQIREQIARWDASLRGVWQAEEIDDVAVYLNDLYYHFPCPAALCLEQRAAAVSRATSAAAPAATTTTTTTTTDTTTSTTIATTTDTTAIAQTK